MNRNFYFLSRFSTLHMHSSCGQRFFTVIRWRGRKFWLCVDVFKWFGLLGNDLVCVQYFSEFGVLVYYGRIWVVGVKAFLFWGWYANMMVIFQGNVCCCVGVFILLIWNWFVNKPKNNQHTQNDTHEDLTKNKNREHLEHKLEV